MSETWADAGVLAQWGLLVVALLGAGGALYRWVHQRQRQLEERLALSQTTDRERIDRETRDNSSKIIEMGHRLDRVEARLRGIDDRDNRTDAKLDKLIEGQSELRGELNTMLKLMNGKHD